MTGKQDPREAFEGMHTANFGKCLAQGDAATLVRQDRLTFKSLDREEICPASNASAPIIGHGLRMVRKRTLCDCRCQTVRKRTLHDCQHGAKAHPTVRTST